MTYPMLPHRFTQRWLKNSYYPWLIWGLAASAFFIEYFARVAPGVMIDSLMRDFKVQALALGSLSAFFYYAYVGMQIPVGILIDRFSLRWLLAIMILICAMACLIFGLSTQLPEAAFARLLMGFGAAFAFVGALKIASVWFPARQFGLLAGLTQAVGMLGAAVGQMPMAYLVVHIGWRATLFLIAGFMMLLALVIAIVVRDRLETPKTSIKKNFLHSPWSGIVQVLKNPQSWWNALFAGLLYAPTAALAELWGVKFFRQTYHLSNEIAAMAVGLIFIGWAIGGPVSGWISDRIKRRKIVLILSAFLSLLLASLILLVPHLPLMLLFSLLFLYGLANTGVATAYAVASEINSHAISGTSVAFANMASVLIGAGFQPLIGWLLEKNWDGTLENGLAVYSASDFHSALLVLLSSLLLAVLVAFGIKETYCQRK
ncbi:MAG: MFS transporter [Pseudomonadota bacterium]